MDTVMWKLGSRSTYASITIYNGIPKVHLRQHIALSDGTMRPTKKGIALNFDEWEAFKSCLSNIDSELRRVQSQQVVTEPVLDLNRCHQGGSADFPTIS